MKMIFESYCFPEGKTPVVAKSYKASVFDPFTGEFTDAVATLLYGWHPKYKKVGRLICQRILAGNSLYTHHKLIARYSAGEPL